MVTKMIAKTDCFIESAKARAKDLHKKARDDRGAEMLEIALVVGVVIGIYGAFRLLQGSVTNSLNEARNSVEQKKP